MYEYMPNGSRGKLKGLCMGMFAGAIALFFASGIEGILYPAVMQLISVMIITVTIMLMGRYLLRHYLYRVADDGEGLDFLVDEISRRGRYTVCRLAMSQLVSAVEWSDETKPAKDVKIYNYCVDVKPVGSWVLDFVDGEDHIFIRLSPDDRLKEIFAEAVARNTQEVGQ
jgi:hypothetical protein